jgi:hypothetical protein
MKRLQFIALLALGACSCLQAKEARTPGAACYELRIYHAQEGKLDALHARFRDHTMRLFERHGMKNIAYWVPVENSGRRLIYLLSYPDAAAREKSWRAFAADPEWISAKAASEVGGALVAKHESLLLGATEFSPALETVAAGGVFEMRTYTASPGNLPNLLNRFRDHTLGLFSKHGMQHLGYYTPMAGQSGAGETLIYFLGHASSAAQVASFAEFRADPAWLKAKAASEAAAGGSLTVVDGVKSELLVATDYSPLK